MCSQPFEAKEKTSGRKRRQWEKGENIQKNYGQMVFASRNGDLRIVCQLNMEFTDGGWKLGPRFGLMLPTTVSSWHPKVSENWWKSLGHVFLVPKWWSIRASNIFRLEDICVYICIYIYNLSIYFPIYIYIFIYIYISTSTSTFISLSLYIYIYTYIHIYIYICIDITTP